MKPQTYGAQTNCAARVAREVAEGANPFAQVSSAGFLQRTLFSGGCAIKNLLLRFGVCSVPGVDHLVFEKIKSRLGGRVKVIVSGGAPLAGHVEHFLKLTMCCPVTQVRYTCVPRNGCLTRFVVKHLQSAARTPRTLVRKLV